MSRLGRRGIAAIAGALWLATLPAHAAEHAGTSSPLSTGAGNRALAMGGAFAAVADDASGWMWNPGGLGLVSRGHVEITQFAPADLDYSDIFAGLVLPSWRWGALALGYRQIGVSGIEARDARNQVVATGLSDRESEIALGYGNALGEAWSFGVVAKARSHQLAGRSAGALGADLGVILHPAALLGSGGWLRDLTVGAAFQNAVRPSIRLDVDPVPDPRAVRAGLAYRHALTGGRGLLFALDLDRTRISSPRLHAGVELKPHPMLDLRVGLNQSELATGAGLRVGRLSFDYAF